MNDNITIGQTLTVKLNVWRVAGGLKTLKKGDTVQVRKFNKTAALVASIYLRPTWVSIEDLLIHCW